MLQISEKFFVHKIAKSEAFCLKDTIPAPHREEIKRGWRKLCIEKLHSSLNIAIEGDEMGGLCGTTEEMTIVYKIAVKNLKCKTLLGHGRGYENNAT